MTPLRALALLEPVVSALAAAHRAGLIHRDVKPENVLIADEAHGGGVKVADFGLAKAVSADTQHTATGGVLIGTVVLPGPRARRGRAGRRPRRRLRRGRRPLRAAHRAQAARGREPDPGRLPPRPRGRPRTVHAQARPPAVRRRAGRPGHEPRPHPAARRRGRAAAPDPPRRPGAARGRRRRPGADRRPRARDAVRRRHGGRGGHHPGAVRPGRDGQPQRPAAAPAGRPARRDRRGRPPRDHRLRPRGAGPGVPPRPRHLPAVRRPSAAAPVVTTPAPALGQGPARAAAHRAARRRPRRGRVVARAGSATP